MVINKKFLFKLTVYFRTIKNKSNKSYDHNLIFQIKKIEKWKNYNQFKLLQ